MECDPASDGSSQGRMLGWVPTVDSQPCAAPEGGCLPGSANCPVSGTFPPGQPPWILYPFSCCPSLLLTTYLQGGTQYLHSLFRAKLFMALVEDGKADLTQGRAVVVDAVEGGVSVGKRLSIAQKRGDLCQEVGRSQC